MDNQEKAFQKHADEFWGTGKADFWSLAPSKVKNCDRINTVAGTRAQWDSGWRNVRVDICNAVSTLPLHQPQWIDQGSALFRKVMLLRQQETVFGVDVHN